MVNFFQLPRWAERAGLVWGCNEPVEREWQELIRREPLVLSRCLRHTATIGVVQETRRQVGQHYFCMISLLYSFVWLWMGRLIFYSRVCDFFFTLLLLCPSSSRQGKKVESTTTAGDDAQKKFGNAKSISSDMYFGNNSISGSDVSQDENDGKSFHKSCYFSWWYGRLIDWCSCQIDSVVFWLNGCLLFNWRLFEKFIRLLLYLFVWGLRIWYEMSNRSLFVLVGNKEQPQPIRG